MQKKPVTAPRTVVGYHGCSQEAASAILNELNFLPSLKVYDWLGEGVYFWEYAPYRALEWAVQKCAREGGEPAVLRAAIQLGRCMNLLDTEHIPGLVEVYDSFAEDELPRNTDQGAHYLDRFVIDTRCRGLVRTVGNSIQTVRGSFAEGRPIYPGSKILTKAHTQIAVRDASCISGVSMVLYA